MASPRAAFGALPAGTRGACHLQRADERHPHIPLECVNERALRFPDPSPAGARCRRRDAIRRGRRRCPRSRRARLAVERRVSAEPRKYRAACSSAALPMRTGASSLPASEIRARQGDAQSSDTGRELGRSVPWLHEHQNRTAPRLEASRINASIMKLESSIQQKR